jgi:uncharacterized protein (TIGR02118 family)
VTIAAISFIRRRDDVTLTRFRRHWLDVHGPLVCRFAGLQRYAQYHVMASPAMNDVARAMRMDGFPILYFADEADRMKAHGSPEMAACNLDSQQFIGAVSRVMADVETVVVPKHSPISLLVLSPEGEKEFQPLPRSQGLIRFHVREQGAAPNSTVPHLPVTVGAVTQLWFDSLVDLEEAVADARVTGSGLFVVEEHPLDPVHQ